MVQGNQARADGAKNLEIAISSRVKMSQRTARKGGPASQLSSLGRT